MERLTTLLLEWRRPIVVLAHVAIWFLAYIGSFLLRFDFLIPSAFMTWVYAGWVVPLILFRLGTFTWYGLFQGMWKYTGQRDLEDILKATLLSTGIFALAVFAVGPQIFPRSVFLAEPMIALGLASGLRLSVRALATTARRVESKMDRERRLLIVGAGDAGEMLLREIRRNMPNVVPVGFVDDDPLKWGMRMHGFPVLGRIDDAGRFLRELAVSEVMIALPSATGREMRRIVDAVSHEGVSVRTLPDLEHLIDGRVTVQQLREVAIEDLLGRDPVQLDQQRISDLIRSDVVLVTGAGGSIGSELCRQVARFHPRILVLVEQAENSLYHIHRELEERFPSIELLPRIADVTDRDRVDEVFSETRPNLVLHAAAHKHVPMMEWNPGEAVKNNVGGTRALAEAAHRHGVARFVMISTDKAVNPTSVMGCTKRVAELYVQAMAEHSRTVFATVRFGNVLGSNGSVIPLFREQIARGGPVTVTHPDMIRYFMTIPEASQLVLQAAAIGQSGEIYVLDMGEPVRIVQLAEDLIRLSGLQPHKDVEIVFTGVRPGEKLFEELSTSSEDVSRTRHEKIFVGKSPPRPYAEVRRMVEDLLERPESVRASLQAIVPEFTFKADPQEPARVIPLRS